MAGSISSGGTGVRATSRPRRLSPAMARKVAAACPSASLRSRVCTLPRNSTTARSGRRWRSCARRRRLEVPTTAPAGRSARPPGPSVTKASRTSSRGKQAGDGEAVGLLRRHVLHRVHGDVDGAGEERLLDLAGEEPLAAELAERPVLHPVAGGLDRHDQEGGLGQAVRRHQPRPGLVRLGERQRAAAGADAERPVGRGRSSSGDAFPSRALSVRSARHNGAGANAGRDQGDAARARAARRCRFRRSGSCARPGATCRSTARPGRGRATSSTSATRPSWRRR